MTFRKALFVLMFSLTGSFSALAGGPLVVTNGQPALWQGNNPQIEYRLDQGRLGPLSNRAADTLMDEAFAEWEAVEGATIRFDRDSQTLPVDADGDTYFDLINSQPNETDMMIAYDDDGSIVDEVFGGNARQTILGFASPFTVGGRIAFAVCAFNGQFFDRLNFDADMMYPTILHEFGHMIGFDHAQYNRHFASNGVGIDDRFLSVLYPFSSDGEQSRLGLALDDRISLGNLYPNIIVRPETGQISGIVRRGNRGLPGVNVIARERSNPTEIVASTVTGTLSANGNYELAGLPPGEYEVMIESVDPRFIAASSVGQYAETPNSLSFRDPVLAEYYNAIDAGDEARSLADVVVVRANQNTSNINFTANSESRGSDEDNIRLLAIGSFAEGGLVPFRTYNNVFVLNPSGDELGLDVTIEFDQSIRHDVRLGIENSAGSRSTRTISGNGDRTEIHIGDGGDASLTDRRYFFGFSNRSQDDVTYRIEVQETQPTPTPRPVLFDADLNEDGFVDRRDFLLFANDWYRESRDRLSDSKLSDDDLPTISPNDLLQWIEQYRESNQLP